MNNKFYCFFLVIMMLLSINNLKSQVNIKMENYTKLSSNEIPIYILGQDIQWNAQLIELQSKMTDLKNIELTSSLHYAEKTSCLPWWNESINGLAKEISFEKDEKLPGNSTFIFIDNSKIAQNNISESFDYPLGYNLCPGKIYIKLLSKKIIGETTQKEMTTREAFLKFTIQDE